MPSRAQVQVVQEHEAIRVLALQAVLEQDDEYWLRFIRRWYSHRFYTPLHAVEDLPMAYVLQNFYEAYYERQDEDKLEAERVDLSKTSEERWRDTMRHAADKASDAEFQKFAEAQAEAEKALAAARAKVTGAKPKAPDAFGRRAPVPEAQIPDVRTPEPDIRLTFVRPEDLEAEIGDLDQES